MASRREASTVALAVLSCAAALSLGRVFADGSFAPAVIGAALLPHAVGLVSRRRRWSPVATVAVTVVALVLYVSWLLVPASTTYGIPGIGRRSHAGSTTGGTCTGRAARRSRSRADR